MNKTITAMMSLALLTLASCGSSDDEKIIEKPDFTPPADSIFNIDALEALGRVTDPKVSPDGKKVLFGISYENVEENKSNRELYVINLDGTDMKRLTTSARSESNGVWIDNGERIAFTVSEGEGKPQMWVMNADGSGRKAVSDLENGVEGFVVSPDGKHVILISTVKYGKTAQDFHPDLDKADGRLLDDVMYKHWDEWVTAIPHPFLADFDGNKLDNVVDILEGKPFESPMRPWGGVESFSWAPDSKSFIYTCREKTGLEYSRSTNSDLFEYNLETKEVKNLTEGMMGYDTNPAFSPDGKFVAWLSMEHDGYESDKNRIFLLDRSNGERRDLTANWDYHADQIAWNPDCRSIYFIAPYQGVQPIFKVEIDSCRIDTVATGVCDYAALEPVDSTRLVTMHHSMIAPNEIYLVDNGKESKITAVNDELLAALEMPKVEKVMVPTTDGKQMTTWVIYPPKFDPNKKYPSILYCQGGPQSSVSQFFSYRWNLALMASHGYIIIAPNRRGLPGFGTEWNAQISKDYGGQNMRDYLSAVDFMKKEPYIDPARIGCTGASYGGFSVYWLAGNHDKRIAAFFAHAGIFNLEAQYTETEELWFVDWDLGGPFWDKSNAAAQRSYATSPHKFVDRWDAPIMVSHGEFDFRILASQGMAAFNAAKMRGIPTRMIIFPDENHWILKPQNAIQWQREFFRWFDEWLKPDHSIYKVDWEPKATEKAAAEGDVVEAPDSAKTETKTDSTATK